MRVSSRDDLKIGVLTILNPTKGLPCLYHTHYRPYLHGAARKGVIESGIDPVRREGTVEWFRL